MTVPSYPTEMLLVRHEPPSTAKLAVPHDCPDGEITSTFWTQAPLTSDNGSRAYPVPPWTMCSVTSGCAASHEGAAESDVASGSNWPSQARLPPREAEEEEPAADALPE